MFGREDRGLTNEELQLCNLHLHIPTSAAYSSLNLAMAVQIVCYELRMLLLKDQLYAILRKASGPEMIVTAIAQVLGLSTGPAPL